MRPKGFRREDYGEEGAGGDSGDSRGGRKELGVIRAVRRVQICGASSMHACQMEGERFCGDTQRDLGLSDSETQHLPASPLCCLHPW